MREAIYFVGAGFSKSLQRKKPVPMMMDFVRCMTYYARTDNVVLMALIGLEALRCYEIENPELHKLATQTNPMRRPYWNQFNSTASSQCS